MATIKHKHYDYNIASFDDVPHLMAIDLEENGVVYTYLPSYRSSSNKPECYVSYIEEGVEDVIIADVISNVQVGTFPVVRWGIPLIDSDTLKQVKTLQLGKNLTSFIDLTMSGFDKLEKLIIPSSFKSFPPIKDCKSLKEIEMPVGIADLENIAYMFPSLQRIKLNKENSIEIIDANHLVKLRESYQKKLEEEERAMQRKMEEEEKEKRYHSFDKFIEEPVKWRVAYIYIACALPYIWFAYKSFVNMINNGLGFINNIFQSIAIIIAFFIAWFVAVTLTMFMDYYTREKTWVLLFCPLVSVPLSWVLLMIIVYILSLFNSCEDAVFGFTDPKFLF